MITLGIIGVVAAITMPSLIAKHQKQQTVVQLKKVYSDLSNAIKMSEVDNGPMADWNYPTCTSYAYSCIEPFLKTYYLPYFKGVQVVDKRVLNQQKYNMLTSDINGLDLSIITHYIILNNGTILSFFSNIENGYIWLFADLNGMKGPNKIGRDIFVFDAYRHDGMLNDKYIYRLKFWGFSINSIEDLKSKDGYACNKNNTAQYKNFYCGRLIELNGWKIPDDYPW